MAQGFGRSLVDALMAGQKFEFDKMLALQEQLFKKEQAAASQQQFADTQKYNRERDTMTAERDRVREENTRADNQRAQMAQRGAMYQNALNQGLPRMDALTESGLLSGMPWGEKEITDLARPAVMAEASRRYKSGERTPGKTVQGKQSTFREPNHPLEDLMPIVLGGLGGIPGGMDLDVPTPPTMFGGMQMEEPQGMAAPTQQEVMGQAAPKFQEAVRKAKAIEGIRMTHEKTLAERQKTYSDRVENDKVFRAATSAYRATSNELKGRLVTLKEEWQKQILPLQGKLIQARTESEKNRAKNMAMGKLDIHYRPIAAMYNRYNQWESKATKDLLEAESVLSKGEPQAPVRRTAAGLQVEDEYDPAYLYAVKRYVDMTAQRDAAQAFLDQLHGDEDYIGVMGAENPLTGQREGGLWEEVSGLRRMMNEKKPAATGAPPAAGASDAEARKARLRAKGY